MLRLPHRAAVALLLAGFQAAAQGGDAPARRAVEEPRALMVAALSSPDGESHGVIVGPWAQALRQRLHTSTPLLLDVYRLGWLPGVGCARLRMVFRQSAVPGFDGGSPADQEMEVGINYCLDGTAPAPAGGAHAR